MINFGLLSNYKLSKHLFLVDTIACVCWPEHRGEHTNNIYLGTNMCYRLTCLCSLWRNSTPGEHTEDPKSSNAHPESSRYVTTPEVGDQVEYDYIDDTALQRRAGNQGRQNAVGPAETGEYLELTATQGDNKDDQYTGLTAIQGAINRVDNKMYESLATEKQRPTHPLPSHR